MHSIINVKTLRTELASILKRVERGERFTVLYRSRPVFRIVPMEAGEVVPFSLDEDPLYEAGPVGTSTDGKTAKDHDDVLYG